MAGAEVGELTPPGATRPQAVMSQPHANRIRSNLNREPPTEEALCSLSRVRNSRPWRLVVSDPLLLDVSWTGGDQERVAIAGVAFRAAGALVGVVRLEEHVGLLTDGVSARLLGGRAAGTGTAAIPGVGPDRHRLVAIAVAADGGSRGITAVVAGEDPGTERVVEVRPDVGDLEVAEG